MANIFIFTPSGSVPYCADKNATRLILNAATKLGCLSLAAQPAREPVKPLELDAAALVSRQALPMIGAACAMALAGGMTDAPEVTGGIMLLEGEPTPAMEIKRAFRGADSGTSVKVASLDGMATGTISMFRI
jgi:hypothetical protein